MFQLPDQITLLKLLSIQPTHFHVKEQSTQMFFTFQLTWYRQGLVQDKILHALWVAEMCVCMRVCEHSWIKRGKTFPVFGWPDIQQTLKWGWGREGILKSLYATHAGHSLHTLKGLPNCLEFSQPFSCLYQAMQTQKTFCYYFLEYNLLHWNLWTKLFSQFSVKGNTSLKQTKRSMNNIGIKFFFIISGCRNVG